MNLKQRTIKGLSWSVFSQAGRQVSQFIITAILARMLSPKDFGLLAMATIFVNFATIFGEMGISSALIQKQDTHNRHYYSAFWINVVVGVVLTLIFIVASPLIVWFYKKPELQPILIIISINFFISSFVVIQQTILTKEMDFKSLAVRDIIAVVLSGIIGIYLAYHGFGVWSLVYQSIAFTLFNAVLLWILSSWRPKFEFALSDIKDIIHFSANITGFNVVNYFARNIDQVLIGKFLGAQALGFYSLAYKLMLYPLQNVSSVISKVMFPAFSKIKNDIDKVSQNYLKMVKVISLITFPLMLGLLVVAPEFIKVIYGSKWEPVVILLEILCICGMVQSISSTTGNILLSQGRADLYLKLGIMGTIFTIAAIVFGLQWGIYGVAIFYTIEQIIWLPYAQMIVNNVIKLRTLIFLGVFKNSVFCSLLIAGCMILSKSILSLSSDTSRLAILVTIFIFAYGLFIFIFERAFIKNIFSRQVY